MARLAFVAGSLVAVAAGFELALRVYHAARERMHVAALPEVTERILVPSADPGLIYELRPGATKGEFRVNRWGAVGPDFERSKAPGVFRIAIVGDSIACGFGLVPEGRGFPGRLRELVQARAGERPRIEVLNFGVNGYGILQELAMAKDRALGFQPDLLIVQSTLNDPYPTGMPPYTASHTQSWSLAWDFVHRRIAPYHHMALRVVIRNYDEEGIGNVRDAMRGFGEIQRAGTSVLVVLFPYLYARAYREWGFGRFHDLFAEAARASGVAFLDLRELFERERIIVDRWTGDSVHPPEEGHRIAAEAIAARLEALGLLAFESAQDAAVQGSLTLGGRGASPSSQR